MDENNKMNQSDWYRPNDDRHSEGTDDRRETDLYRVRSRSELYEEKQPAKSRGWIYAVICVALVVLAIALTALAFRDDSPQLTDEDLYEAYEKFYEEMLVQTPTGENTIARAPVNPDVALQLQNQQTKKLTLQELYAQCIPSVVGISGMKNNQPYSWGTGVVMTEDGYIITNTHVLDGSDAVEIILHDGTVYQALLVGSDVFSDIAVLKVDAHGLTPAQFADSSQVQVGDDAIAIGNPLGEQFSGTMTTGIISGVSRDINYMQRTMTLLQTNAALNSGNSGGPLFNAYGQVIGITNMKMMITPNSVVEGVGFAIPTVTVKEMVDNILDNGAVVGRPSLGVTVYDLNGGTDTLPDGMMVQGVTEGSDAKKQGLQQGDIITAVDGKAAEDIEVLRGAITAKQVGDTVDVTVWREGETIEMTIALIDQNDM